MGWGRVSRIRFKADFSNLLKELERAGGAALPAAKHGLFDAAAVMADAMKAEALALPFDSSTTSQIANSLGVAKFRDRRSGTDTSISFEGYFTESGFPIQYFVRDLCKGRSNRPANDFERRAYNRAIAAADAAGTKSAETFAQAIIDKIKDK